MSGVGASDDRTLRVDGLTNARDLGGLRRRDGTTTPRGVFYRSDNVDRVTTLGWEQVRAAGIRTVVDLRQPGERAGDTSRRPSWVATVAVDLDGLERQEFWKDYWANGLVGTAQYFLPHLDAMPERAGAALSAIVTADPGGVLFHCMGGRDRTGMIALLLLAAARTEREEIVDDYLETIRRGHLRAGSSPRENAEPTLEALCRAMGTSTEGAFRSALASLDLTAVLAAAGMSHRDRAALISWRGSIAAGDRDGRCQDPI
jgi:protein-tyrosine phosphatase